MSKNEIKLTEAQGDELWNEESLTVEGVGTFKLKEGLEWDDEGKYQNGGAIYTKDDGTFWALYVYRSGSYFSDYEYGVTPVLHQVEKKQVIIERWESI